MLNICYSAIYSGVKGADWLVISAYHSKLCYNFASKNITKILILLELHMYKIFNLCEYIIYVKFIYLK